MHEGAAVFLSFKPDEVVMKKILNGYSISGIFHITCVMTIAFAWLASAIPGYAQQAPAAPAVDNANQELREIRSPDIYFVPTPQEVVEKMLELAKVSKDDVVYDLGCGDGRIVITAAKKYGCRGVGYDIDPKRVMESMENVREQGVMNLVRIEQKDVFTLDLSKASVITLYLLPSLNVKLIPQLKKVKPGTRIVSHDFDMRGVVTQDAAVRMRTDDDMEHTIYLWKAPLKINRTSD